MRRECEASLRRLGVDVIDLYQVHWPEPDADVEEGWAAMARLKAEGKVLWIGVSNFNAAQIGPRRCHRSHHVSAAAVFAACCGIEDQFLPYCERNQIGVIGYSPMASGLLSGGMTRDRIDNLPPDDWRRRNKNFQEPLVTHNLQLVEILRAIGERHGLTAGEVAIAWTLGILW